VFCAPSLLNRLQGITFFFCCQQFGKLLFNVFHAIIRDKKTCKYPFLRTFSNKLHCHFELDIFPYKYFFKIYFGNLIVKI